MKDKKSDRPDPRLHRKIYEKHFGPIPKDSNNRSYEIHHKDGNPYNNDPTNLIALTIKDHYQIHYSQGDYYAALLIASKMKMSPEIISELARQSNLKRLEDGNHPFLHQKGDAHPVHKKIADGSHNFFYQKGDSHPVHKKIADGSHHWLGQTGELHFRYDRRIHKFEHSDGSIFIGTQLEFKKQHPRIASGGLSKMISGEPRANGKFIRSMLGWKYIGLVQS
jgi:hypothetical protein